MEQSNIIVRTIFARVSRISDDFISLADFAACQTYLCKYNCGKHNIWRGLPGERINHDAVR